MTQRAFPALGTALVFGVLSVTSLAGCNKLGYGEPRTAPKGQASLGPKRMPMLNGPELQKQQQAAMTSSARPSIPQPMAGAQPQPMMAPASAPMAMQPNSPMNPPIQVPSLQQMQQMPQSRPLAQPMNLPNLPENYPVTNIPNPYGNGPQSYQLPDQRSQYVSGQQIQAQASSYPLPQEYPAGSYHAAASQAGQHPASAIGDIAHQVSVGAQTDYYVQDMLDNPISATVASMKPQAGWYAPSAPVGQVNGQAIPLPQTQGYQAGYGMEAAYGRYQEPLPAMAVPQANYQPMNANQQRIGYSAGGDPYTQPEYDNVFYGGQGMPRGQSRPQQPPAYSLDPAMESPRGVPMTNGYSQRAGGMVNPVSQQRVLEEEVRRPLEVPPMLGHESELPQPNAHHSQVYYERY